MEKSSLSFTDTEPYVRRGCRTEFSHFDPNSTFVPAGERSATRLITAAARTDHMRAARGAANLYQRSPQGHQPVRIRAASPAQLRPVIGLGQRTGCDAERCHGGIRPFLDTWSLKSSILGTNSF